MLTAFTVLVLASQSPVGSYHPALMVLDDPQAARSFDYCQAPLETPGLAQEIDAALAPEADDASEYEVAAALLVRAGLQIAQESQTADACQSTFAGGDRTFSRLLTSNTRRLRGQAARDRSDDPAVASVQSRIADQWIADQSARLTYVQLQTENRSGSAFWAQRLATAQTVTVDADSTFMMRELLLDYDWIDAHRFGLRVSSHAWILVQHADDHPDFQAEVLERMEAYLDNEGVRPRDYAYLFDRVAVNTGQLQRYGTQPANQCNADGSLDLQPVEDIETLDERRAGIGLGPYRADLEAMASGRCG